MPQKPITIKLGIQIFETFYGIWNQDFLHLFDLDIWFEFNSMAVRSLDFLVAIYLLIVITYLGIILHDYNYRFIVVLITPIKSLFNSFRMKLSIKSSTVEAFKMFLLPSNIKFLMMCYDLLVPVEVCDPSSNGTCFYALFNDPTVPYFSCKHIPYALLALTVFVVFVFATISLLLLYPLRLCQNLLRVYSSPYIFGLISRLFRK